MAFCLSHLAWPPVAAAQCDPEDLLYPTVFYHPDHLGTPQLLTNEDAVIVERLAHRPYGEVSRMEGQGTTDPLQSQADFMFTGQRAADATGLIYFAARYYDPKLGMFVSHDPARQFLSPYSYMGGNPLNGIDPDGQEGGIGLLIALLLVLLSAVATGVQAGLNGASADQASAAGIISLGTGLGTLVAGGFLGAFVGPTAAPATSPGVTAAAQGTTQSSGLAIAGAVTAIGGSAYSAVSAFQNGQYAIGAFAIVAAGAALYGGYRALKGVGKPEPARATGERERGGMWTTAKNTVGNYFGYSSQDRAAYAALSEANPQSIAENREYGGLIYQESDGDYHFTKPARGTPTGFTPTAAVKAQVPAGAPVVGDYHTHGDYSRPVGNLVVRTTKALDAYNSDYFSGRDIRGITADGLGIKAYRGYLGTPSGVFRAYHPASGLPYVIR
jgi:RHS repeat-associated protein